jgi:hypothetical protein
MIQFDKQSGFVAGTLVHTDKGLVPIEQIKVGDIVLSKPDTASNAPNSYKRVVSAYKSSEKKPIQLLGIVNAVREKEDEWYPDDSQHETFLLTEDHPIWIDQVGLASEDISEILNQDISSSQQMGWQPSSFLKSYMHLLLSNGSKEGCTWDSEEELRSTDVDGLYYSAYSQPSLIWNTRRDEIQYYEAAELMMYEHDERADLDLFILENNLPEFLIDFGRFWFSPRRALHIYGAEVVKSFADKPNFRLRTAGAQTEVLKNSVQHLYANDYVYNIEVEDFHTYFVGELGLWVHDAPTNIS